MPRRSAPRNDEDYASSGPFCRISVLAEAKSPVGEDWALAWTEEELLSERVTEERSGWFGTVERQIFALDPFAGQGAETGATRMERSLIMPERPYQALAERAGEYPGWNFHKYLIAPNGQLVGSFKSNVRPDSARLVTAIEANLPE